MTERQLSQIKHFHAIMLYKPQNSTGKIKYKVLEKCRIAIFAMKITTHSFKNYIFTINKTPPIKISDTLQGRLINAELSLQSASHNSRICNQLQSCSQIREL